MAGLLEAIGAAVRHDYPEADVIRAREWLALGFILVVVLGVPIALVIMGIRRWL